MLLCVVGACVLLYICCCICVVVYLFCIGVVVVLLHMCCWIDVVVDMLLYRCVFEVYCTYKCFWYMLL